MAGRLTGKTAIVTGGSRGIGQAIATDFCREGATVILTSRKQEGLDRAADTIAEQIGVRPLAIASHMGDPDRIEAFFEALDEQVGAVDVLVNNAATNPYFGPMMTLEWGAWDKTFEVNLKGTFDMSRRVAQRLVEAGRGGSILNMSSVFGLRGAPWQGVYAMTKAAMVSMTQTLAIEWGPANIRVNAIAPGLVETRFASALIDNPQLAATFTERSALGRHGQPEEIAGIATFLASDESSFVTGQVLSVDGGWSAA